MRISLRARLALITVATVAVALTVANVLVSRYVNASLIDRRDEDLHALARYAAARYSQNLQGREIPPVPDQNQSKKLPFGLAGAYAQVSDQAGQLVTAGYLFGGQHKRPRLPKRPVVGRSAHRYFDTDTPSGTRYRAVAAKVTGRGITVDAALPLTSVDDTKTQLLLVKVVASAAVLGAAGAMVWWLTGLGLRPLRRMQRTAAAIATSDLSARVGPSGKRTEIEQLGASLNGMLAEIETAFAAQGASEARLRQFVADASHELRTPLTTLRGYTELLARGAAADPATLSTAIRRIHDETGRMRHLVNDLLLLAHLDEERSLDLQSVDLVTVVNDVAADARIVDPARTVTVLAPDPVGVTADPARLTQVVSNLVRNARTHTPAGTPIEIRVESGGPEAVVTVIDHGPGIDPELGARVFDRFVRNASTPRADRRGAGLGLAIVAAIIAGHGGRFGVAPTPGGGATFWVRLPLRRSDDALATIATRPAPETSATAGCQGNSSAA